MVCCWCWCCRFCSYTVGLGWVGVLWLQLRQDLVGVTGLSAVRESLMDLKEQMLETCVAELREAVMGGSADMLRVQGYSSDSDSEVHTFKIPPPPLLSL